MRSWYNILIIIYENIYGILEMYLWLFITENSCWVGREEKFLINYPQKVKSFLYIFPSWKRVINFILYTLIFFCIGNFPLFFFHFSHHVLFETISLSLFLFHSLIRGKNFQKGILCKNMHSLQCIKGNILNKRGI